MMNNTETFYKNLLEKKISEGNLPEELVNECTILMNESKSKDAWVILSQKLHENLVDKKALSIIAENTPPVVTKGDLLKLFKK